MAGLLIFAIIVLAVSGVFILATMADPNYCQSGSFFETFPVRCILCEKDSRFSKKWVIENAARNPDTVRDRTTTCWNCKAVISGSYLTHPFVKEILLRAEKNRRNNELYKEFVRQVEAEATLKY